MKNCLFLGILGLFATGCATHSIMRGSVAMKVSDTTAHVCMGTDEVKVGDQVDLYKNQCTPGSPKNGTTGACKKIETGHGKVTQVLNEHYSEVTFDPGTKFEEGDILEKHRH